MRHTSYRRRSGLKVIGKVGGEARTLSEERDITVPDDAPGIVCESCGARVPVLANGRPKAHAPGGVRTNTRKGIYKCSGSGRE